MNPELNIVDIRGNVNTRIRKMEEGYCDAMIMAATGLQRLEMDEHISEIIDTDTMIPACGQGAIAIEIKDTDSGTEELLKPVNHRETMVTSAAERAFLNALEGGCQIPVGSTCEIIGEQIKITGFISSIDGSLFLKDSAVGPIDNADQIARKLAEKLYAQGGKEILEAIRSANMPGIKKDTPLQHKRIISTQAEDDGNALPGLLSEAGAEVILLPAIKIETAELTQKEATELKNLQIFNWVVFTSKNGVRHFFKQLLIHKGDTALPESLRIAAIGKRTAEELDYYGYAPTLTGSKNSAENLIDELLQKYAPESCHFLLPFGNLADRRVEEKLSKDNTVTRINIYKTVKPDKVNMEAMKAIEKGQYDLIVFTSPSAFHNFHDIGEDSRLAGLKIACIGETTAEAVRLMGCTPLVCAKNSSAEGLCEAIIDYYKK